MSLKRSAIWSIPLTLIAASSFSNASDEYVFVPYLEAGIADYSLSFKGDVPGPGGTLYRANNKFYFDFTTYKLGIAGSYGNFYSNIYYQQTSEDADIQDFSGLGLPNIKWSGERSAYSLTIGYQIARSASLFAGYRDSETKGDGSLESDYRFQNDGFFVGGSYQLFTTDTGGLSMALGYAWLDVDLRESLFGTSVPSATGDGSGLKLGVTWRDFFDKRWGYTLAVEYFDYDYDLDIGNDLSSANMQEVETSFSVGLFRTL